MSADSGIINDDIKFPVSRRRLIEEFGDRFGIRGIGGETHGAGLPNERVEFLDVTGGEGDVYPKSREAPRKRRADPGSGADDQCITIREVRHGILPIERVADASWGSWASYELGAPCTASTQALSRKPASDCTPADHDRRPVANHTVQPARLPLECRAIRTADRAAAASDRILGCCPMCTNRRSETVRIHTSLRPAPTRSRAPCTEQTPRART